MRMAELAAAADVPVATVKYYLREGLLHAGEPTAPNQARYDGSHVRRLDLIRALREGAGLPLAAIARALDAMDAHREHTRPAYLSAAVGALSEPVDADEAESPAHVEAGAVADDLLAALGWDVDADSPGRADLVRAIAAIQRHLPGLLTTPAQLQPYAAAVRPLADVEIPEGYDPDVDRDAVLRSSVLGTVLFEPVLTSLRKLAHVDRTRQLAAVHGTQTGVER